MSFLSGLIKKQQIAPPPPRPKDNLIQLDDVFNETPNISYQPKGDEESIVDLELQEDENSSDITEFNNQFTAPNSSSPTTSNQAATNLAQSNWPAMQAPTSSFEQLPTPQNTQWDEPLPDFTQQERHTAEELQEPFMQNEREDVQEEPTKNNQEEALQPTQTLNSDYEDNAKIDYNAPQTSQTESASPIVTQKSPQPTAEPSLPFVSSDHYLQILDSFTQIDHFVEKLNAASTDAISLNETEQVKLEQMMTLINEIRDSCLLCDENIAHAER